LNAWALLNSGGLIGTVRKSKSVSYTPTVAKMVKLATQGWMMSFAYGRYNVVGSFGGAPTVSRDGGHAVTFVRAKRNSGEYVLRYRDPADDSTLSTQAPFSNKIVYPAAVTVHFGGVDVRTMNAIAYPSSDGKIRLVDSYWGIRPNFGYRFVNSSSLQGAGGGSLQLMDPTPFEGAMNQSMPAINFSSFLIVEDVAFHPEMADGLVLARSIFNGQPNLLRLLDLNTGGLTTLTAAPEDLAQICPSREAFIYAYDNGGKVYKLNSEGAIDMANSSTPTPSGIWFDNTSDTLRLLSVSQRRIAKYSKNLVSQQNLVIPTSVPMSGDGSVRVDPTTGKSWFKTDASALLYNVEVVGAGTGVFTITLPTIPGGLRSFQFSENGLLYLMGDSVIKVLKRNVTNGNWSEDPTSPFHNLPGGSRMMMFTNVTNDDPAEHDTPGWNNILAQDLLDIGETRPDCDADLNSDDIVNGADLGILLSKWGQVRGVADLNQDGVVNGADMGLLLAAWGNCL
ncbi:MAG: hypothetical protein JNK53_01125, partial [Phycisphaerae bacterium]|nr:hypothetical protein [Phycisphaerae bacterium]